ncbi:MAG: alkaline phosphatase family protein, partial [Lentisphaerae bacterium]|nr:alkaline phosphatase family protein [Lentisphaerota bacterium]
MESTRKLLVVQAAALGHDFLCCHHGEELDGLPVRPMESVFPALTCPAQASFRTGTLPERHGMIANGLFHRGLGRPLFWEQASSQVEGARIWEGLRDRGGKVAMLFWQQCLGESVDIVLSPAPIHKHHGGMIADCYCRPSGLYERLVRVLGRPFQLHRYWGPFASAKSSQWIADATCHIMTQPDLAPDLCMTYLPALDYDLQRFGTDHPRSRQALSALTGQLRQIRTAAETAGYDILVFGDYAMGACDKGAVLPNRVLRQHGLLECRSVRGMLYPDIHNSRAFSVADHEVAHVYVTDPGDIEAAATLLSEVPGIERVLDRDAQGREGLGHPSSGELGLLAAEGYWLAYPGWDR